jgi:hypothetical protein
MEEAKEEIEALHNTALFCRPPGMQLHNAREVAQLENKYTKDIL